MYLRPAEHLEAPVPGHHSPRQIKESLLRSALRKRPKKVRRAIRLSSDPEHRPERDLLAIARLGFDDFIAFLNPEVDGFVVRESDSRKMTAAHFDCQFIAFHKAQRAIPIITQRSLAVIEPEPRVRGARSTAAINLTRCSGESIFRLQSKVGRNPDCPRVEKEKHGAAAVHRITSALPKSSQTK